MDNREGIKPESTPQPQSTPPTEGMRAGPPPIDPVEGDDGEAQTGFFTPTNMVLLGGMALLFTYLYIKFDPTLIEIWFIIKAALGLSFIIFIHELGHFLAAKWCNVNVTTFSIGFGPPVPGCAVKWGETTYKLGILPLGGYVQMVGQVDGDEGVDDNDDPRSYRKKTVLQRMLIISAGVIMNAILAAVCFIYVYQGPGKEHPAAGVAYLDSSGPAWRGGMRTDARITKIGDVENPTFTDLMQVVINSLKGEKIPIVFERSGMAAETIFIEPRKADDDSKPVIGVIAPSKTQLAPKRNGAGGPFDAGSPAATAGFKYGDSIIAMTDPDDPARKVTPLKDDPNFPDQGQRDFFEFGRRLQLLAGEDVVLTVQRKEGELTKTENLTIKPMYSHDLGVRMQMGPILVVRDGSPAADAKLRGPDPEKKLEPDLIEAVIVADAKGNEIAFEGKTLDPERLPEDLKHWSADLDKAGAKGDRFVTLKIRRHQQEGAKQFGTESVKLKWDNSWRFDRVVPLSPNSPMAIPELGLAYQVRSIVIDVTGKDSPFKAGDVIKNRRYSITGAKEDKKIDWLDEEIQEGQWANLSFELLGVPHTYKKLEFKVKRGQETVEIEVPVVINEKYPLSNRGWHLAADTRRIKADDPIEAITMGLKDTHARMMEVFKNIRGMILRRIDYKQIGGPITIVYGTVRFASMPWGEFIFFLGLISINLAVVNFLPIPILDGGHMVFLLYEWIRRKPASEAVRVWATYIGLAMILCLMIFVLTIDINRFFIQK